MREGRRERGAAAHGVAEQMRAPEAEGAGGIGDLIRTRRHRIGRERLRRVALAMADELEARDAGEGREPSGDLRHALGGAGEAVQDQQLGRRAGDRLRRCPGSRRTLGRARRGPVEDGREPKPARLDEDAALRRGAHALPRRSEAKPSSTAAQALASAARNDAAFAAGSTRTCTIETRGRASAAASAFGKAAGASTRS